MDDPERSVDNPVDAGGYAGLQRALDQMRALAPPGSGLAPRTALRAALVALEFYLNRGPAYGESWARRGAQGIFHNVARKFDRLEHATLTAPGPTPQRFDDLADLATYALLQLGWHLVRRPEEAEAFLAESLGTRGHGL